MTNKYIKNDCSSVCFHTKLQSFFTFAIFFYLYIATTLAVTPVASTIVTKSSASCLVKPFAARVGTLSITFFASAGR